MAATCDLEHINKIAADILRQRLNGEDPRCDMSAWERRAAKGCDVFRDAARDAVNSVSMGHMDATAALEILEDCRKGIAAFLSLNDTPWKHS